MSSNKSAEQQVLAIGFRRLARQFELLSDSNAEHRERLANLDEQRINTEGGQLIMQAAELELLGALPKVAHLAKWARGEAEHPEGLDKATSGAVYVRHPANVFREVAGYYEMIIRPRRAIRAGEIVRNNDPDIEVLGIRHVGILPEWMPGAFPSNPYANQQVISPDEVDEFRRRRATLERDAAARACLALASLVEQGAAATIGVKPADAFMSLSKAADDLRRAGFDLPKRFRQLIEENRGKPEGIPGKAWRKDRGRVNDSYHYNPAMLAPWLESRGVQRSCK